MAKLNGGGKLTASGVDISNLKSGKPYLFSLEKSGKNFTWKINEKEVHRMENSEINYPLHIHASSIVVHEVPGHFLPAEFEIDWIKCYRKKTVIK